MISDINLKASPTGAYYHAGLETNLKRKNSLTTVPVIFIHLMTSELPFLLFFSEARLLNWIQIKSCSRVIDVVKHTNFQSEHLHCN